MPAFPATTEEAQRLATRIAGSYENFQCVDCCRDIVKSLGPAVDASVIKLRVQRGRPGVILLRAKEQIATTGQHVGIRIGARVYDNHNPEGAPWRSGRHFLWTCSANHCCATSGLLPPFSDSGFAGRISMDLPQAASRINKTPARIEGQTWRFQFTLY